MILTALCIALGFFYRYALTLFLLIFTYFELVDATNYLNHHYLVILFGVLLLFAPAHRFFSLDTWRGTVTQQTVAPRFYVSILILQIAIVYTFAGIAKINTDWLMNAMPLRIWLLEYQDLPLIGGLLKHVQTAFAFSWFAALYDCTIVYFLLFKKTRNYAYFTVIIFHGLTALFFNIGIFPWLMILSNLLFFGDGFHNKLYAYTTSTPLSKPSSSSLAHPYLLAVVALYFMVQLVLPLRHLVYSGDTMVTELGYRFGWRVMLLEKAGIATFTLLDRDTQRSMEIKNKDYLSEFQEKQMAIQPDFMLQFARHVAQQNKELVSNPKVIVSSFITLNGRMSQRFIEPELNLLALEDDWGDKPWIIYRSIK